MADLYVRIDDRLVHGQTIVARCSTLQIKKIMTVDSVNTKNPMLKTTMTTGVPGTYKTHIVTTEETREISRRPGNSNRLMIMEQPEALTTLKEEIAGAKAVIPGSLVRREDSRHKLDGATRIFYLSSRDVEILGKFAADGLGVFFHQLSTSTRTTWKAFKETI